ncbi:MFS transporter [Chloroflexota bacterium]
MGDSKQGIFYGWIALVGAMLIHFCNCGIIFYSYGVFLPSLIETFGWSRSALSAPYTLLLLIMGLLGPLVGVSVSKFGARKNIVIGNLVAFLGLMGMYLTSNIWHIYLFYSILVGIGSSFGVVIPTLVIANNWFMKRRSIGISMLWASRGVGGLVFPPVIALLIPILGWRLVWVSSGAIYLILAVIIGGILIRNKPEDMGQITDGEVTEVAQETTSKSQTTGRVYQTPVDWKTGDALRSPALWMTIVFSAATMFSLHILSTHQVVYFQGLGFSPVVAATALGSVVGISVIGRLLIGFLSSRIEGRYLAALCLAGFSVGIIVLMNAKTIPLMYLYVVVTGLSVGSLVIRPNLIGAYYGRAYYANILGWTAPINALISSVGPLVAGFIYDNTGSYIRVFTVAIAVLGVGLVCALLARPPEPLSVEE